jgi:hypothetical protein
MEFMDDELEVLHCFEPWMSAGVIDGVQVRDVDFCDSYKLNQSVKSDADQGCW